MDWLIEGLSRLEPVDWFLIAAPAVLLLLGMLGEHEDWSGR